MGEGVFLWFWAWDFGNMVLRRFWAWDLRVDIWANGYNGVLGIWFRDFWLDIWAWGLGLGFWAWALGSDLGEWFP